MEKETWIDEVLNSTNGITPVLPDAKLFSKIQNRIKKTETVSPQWLWLAAASLALLLTLNIKIIYSSKSKSRKTPTEKIAADMSNTNQLY
jgi:hypothetical protein